MSKASGSDRKYGTQRAFSRRSVIATGAGLAGVVASNRVGAQHHSHGTAEASPVAELLPTPQLRGTRDVGGTGEDLDTRPAERDADGNITEPTPMLFADQHVFTGPGRVCPPCNLSGS